MNRVALSFLISVAVVVGFSGCKKKAPAPDVSAMELLGPDLASLHTKEHPGFAIYDRFSGGQFSSFFGGTSTADVAAYLDTRAKHFFDPKDRTTGVAPGWILDQPWLNLGDSIHASAKKGKVGASNIGLTTWIAGLIANAPVTFFFRDGPVELESPRTGVISLGPGYRAKETDQRGRSIPLPPEFRQAILIHEARHSDCTGGISRKTLDRIRDVRTNEDLEKAVRKTACGHLHIQCPRGHDYEGEAACDREAWGAYTAGEIFYRGVREDPGISELDYQIATAMIIDLAGRTQVLRSGRPDLTSKGLVKDDPEADASPVVSPEFGTLEEIGR